MDDASYSALHKLATEWNKAEGLMKLAERVRAEVVFPSVNELRYAGRRLIDAWSVIPNINDAAVKSDFDGYFKDALFRCHCAQHDAIDATVLFVQAAIDEYEKEFGAALLLTHFPEVADLRLSLKEADDLIVSSRKDRGKRSDEYDKLAATHLPNITLIYSKIQTNRKSLEALVADKAASERRDNWRYRGNIIWGLGIALLSAILGIAGTLLTPSITKAISKRAPVASVSVQAPPAAAKK